MPFVAVPKKDNPPGKTTFKASLDVQNCKIFFNDQSGNPISILQYNGWGGSKNFRSLETEEDVTITGILSSIQNTATISISYFMEGFSGSTSGVSLLGSGNINDNCIELTLVQIILDETANTLDLTDPSQKEYFIQMMEQSTFSEIFDAVSFTEPYYIDLGLPSGTLWAKHNVGAAKETDYGEYFMYGMGAKPYNSTDTPYAGTEDPLSSAHDTATQVWGGAWHMPTEEQMQELIDNTTQEWTDSFGPGVAGVAFTGTNGNIIFMPACGYYENNTLQGTADYGNVWSSNCFEDSNNANLLYFFVDGSGQTQCYTTNEYRYYGYSVRPVIG